MARPGHAKIFLTLGVYMGRWNFFFFWLPSIGETYYGELCLPNPKIDFFFFAYQQCFFLLFSRISKIALRGRCVVTKNRYTLVQSCPNVMNIALQQLLHRLENKGFDSELFIFQGTLYVSDSRGRLWPSRDRKRMSSELENCGRV